MRVNNTHFHDSFIWDGHSGFTATAGCQLDSLLQPWLNSGFDVLSINVYYDPQAWTDATQNIDSFCSRLPKVAPYCKLAPTINEIDQTKANGELAVFFDIEGMNALNGQLDMVNHYYERGVRQMAIAYNRNNLAGSGCHDEDTGLTKFGYKVIDEMNHIGMTIDCSHAGFKTTMDAMERTTHPVIFSHSNPRSLVDHARNITDEQIKACANTGGVIGISGVNLFLGERESTPNAVAQHVAYVAEMTGTEHVGISLDFDPEEEARYQSDALNTVMEISDNRYWPVNTGYDRPAQTLSVRRLPDIVNALKYIGFDKQEIRAILGDNFRRVAEQVWRKPSKLQNCR